MAVPQLSHVTAVILQQQYQLPVQNNARDSSNSTYWPYEVVVVYQCNTALMLLSYVRPLHQ